jgi:hypothetical protein
MRAWTTRLVSVLLAGGGLCAGLALGSLGATGCCFCPEPEAVEAGNYEVGEDTDRLDLEGARVEARSDRVEIRFTDPDGADWRIVYRVE